MKLVTYNLRYLYKTADGVNSFIHRAGLILDTIAGEKPDIICFQEATEANIGFLRRYLAPDYTVFLNQREPGLTGEGLAVAYRQDKVSLYGLEVLWLSPTPHEIASKFPGQSQHSRICQKLLFKNEQTGNLFRVYNLHLEELSEDVRVQQVELALSWMEAEAVPTVLLGDFNSTPERKVYAACKEKGLVELTEQIPITFHAVGTKDPGYKLDYIFVDPDLAKKVSAVTPWDQCVNGIYLSDHYPIAAEIDL